MWRARARLGLSSPAWNGSTSTATSATCSYSGARSASSRASVPVAFPASRGRWVGSVRAARKPAEARSHTT